MKNDQNKFKKNDLKLDNVLERGKKFLEFMSNNVYDTNIKMTNTNDHYQANDNFYLNPFTTVKREEERMDTLDRIDLLEYSQEFKVSKDNKIEKEKDSISISHDSIIGNNFEMNIKDYDNFIFKIEDLVLLEQKILNNLKKENLLYVECKVPLFKIEESNKKTDSISIIPSMAQLFYDTFKIFNKGGYEKNNQNKFPLSHVSYHKLKLGEENFGVLANSKIQLLLHKLDTKIQNEDIIIGSGEIEFNKIFLSKDFFYTTNLEIFNYKVPHINLDNEDKKSSEINKRNQGKKAAGRQQNNTNLNSKLNNKKKGDEFDVSYKIGEIQISCQLFKSNFEKEKDLKENIKKIEKFNEVVVQGQDESSDYPIHHNSNNNELEKKTDEIKIDYEGILVIYLNIQNLKQIENLQVGKNKHGQLSKNYYISHKCFPNAEVCTSEIMWNTMQPNFNYSMTMPFNLNGKTIEMLENGCLMLELWHKGNFNDDLLGTVKLELYPILDSLKIAEDTLSITPISKNLLPLFIYDDFYPVFNYEDFINICYLNVTIGFGTSNQINNFTKKQNFTAFNNINRNNPNIEDKNNNKSYERSVNNVIETDEDNKSNFLKNSINEKNTNFKNNVQVIDQDINDINNLLNNKNSELNFYTPALNNKKNQNIEKKQIVNTITGTNQNFENQEIDVEEILERNKKELENLYSGNKFKATSSTIGIGETKKYEGNPFLILNNNETFKDNRKDNKKLDTFKVSKESNFFINENPREEIEKFTDNEFYNPNKYQPRVKKMEHTGLNFNSSENMQNIPDFKNLKIAGFEEKIINKIDSESNNLIINPLNKSKLPYENIIEIQTIPITKNKLNNEISNNLDSQKINKNDDPSEYNSGVKHVFEINIDKLINLLVISKLNYKCYLKYSFLSENEIKSDSLIYTNYERESSVIEIDMKTSHSIFLSKLEKIKDYVQDFCIYFCYISDSNEEIIFGKVNLPSEEIISFTNKINNEMNTTLFIYGTEKIKRPDCIIGKMTIKIKYEKVQNSEVLESSENILIERQTIFNRKIPKNASFIFKLNYFKYEDNFLDYFDINSGSSVFYLEIDLFGQDDILKNKFPKQFTSKKYNSLNGIFEEEFVFDCKIESEILEYLKNNCTLINLIVYNKKHNFINSSCDYNEDEEEDSNSNNFSHSNFKKLVGFSKIKLSEIISNTDYINKNYLLISKNNSNIIIGSINVDIKLENSILVQRDFTNKSSFSSKNVTKNTKMKIENLKEIIKEKNEKNLDGKYFFIINLSQLIYDENFLNKLLNYDEAKGHQNTIRNINKNISFYFMYKFGKNIKKISNIYETNQKIELIISPKIFINNLNHVEILDFNISFSRNKPEDIIKQLMENVYEIKLFMKSEDDNIYLGSFIIDLSKLFNQDLKINSNIYYSDTCNIYYFDANSKQLETLKLSSTFTLIKSDLTLTDFTNFYNNTFSSISNKNNLQILKNLIYKTNSVSESIKKVLQSLINTNECDYYEYLDLYLFNFEDDNNEIILENILKFLKVFGACVWDNFENEIDEIINLLDEFFEIRKINLKKSLGLSNSKYSIMKLNVDLLFTGNGIENFRNVIQLFFKITLIDYKINFSLYEKKDEKNLDLFDFLLFIYKLRGTSTLIENENINYQMDKSNAFINMNLRKEKNIPNLETDFYKLTIIVYSASNLTLENKKFSEKPNCYFIMNWKEDCFTSDVVVKTSHPSWNQKLEIKIPSDHNLNLKLNNPIVFQFFSKEFSEYEYDIQSMSNKSTSTYNKNNKANNSYMQEFIGELSVNIHEVINFNFFNERGEYEDFFNIMNNNRVRGQVNIKFLIDEKNNSKMNNTQANRFSNYSSKFENSKNNFNLNKKYEDDDDNLDTNSLWEKLNKNTVRINY